MSMDEEYKCAGCGYSHMAPQWYCMEDYGEPKYLCGEEFNKIPPQKQAEWKLFHPSDPD
jgi:hypothetical protein